MNKNFVFLRKFFWNYILAFLVIFSIYSIPFIFLAVLGVFYLFQTNHWFIFFGSVFGFFFLIFLLVLIFRFFRLPHFTSAAQEKAARSQADDFINSFSYSSLEFTNPKPISEAIFELNRRIARSFGVLSPHPERDVPIGYLLYTLRSVSTDLENFCSQLKLNNIEPLSYIKLSHILWFVPKSPKQPVTDSSAANHGHSSFIPAFVQNFIRERIFKFVFTRIAHYSIQLYSGKVLSERRHFSFRNFSPIRKFFRTRLLLWPIVWGFFGLSFFVCLIVCGPFYSSDSVCELIQICRNCKANGLISFSTLPWDQILFRVLPGALALIFSCLFYFIPYFCHLRFSPFKVQPVPEWPEREMENFRKTKDFINSLKVSRLRTFSSFAEVIQELLSFSDSCCKKPESAAFSLSLSEILKAQQILISRLQTKFNDEFPFINYFNIRDFLFANRLYNLYLKFFLVFRSYNFCVNPLSGSVTEVRIRMNRSLLQSMLEEFLVSGNIFVLDLIGYYLIEVYSGYLHFPEKGLPVAFYLAGGTEDQRQSICSALLNISDLNLDIQMQSNQASSTFRSWIPFLNRSNHQMKKMEEQIRQSDLVLFLDPKKTDSEKTDEFQKIPDFSEFPLESSEKPPLAVWVTSVPQTPLPCSGDFCAVPWQNDDESVFQEAIQSLLKQNQQRILSRQIFRFLRDYKEKHGR